MKNFFKSFYFFIILLFIYIPIFILMIFSFNSSFSNSHFKNFSLKWYYDLFNNELPFQNSILLSLIIAILATIISIIIGTMTAISLSKAKKITRKITLFTSSIPLINADIITALGLVLIFTFFSIPFGFISLLFAHISFIIPYVIMIIYPNVNKIDNTLIESSIDLGAKPLTTLFKVILPNLKIPIIISSFICIAMSFDDFTISYFTGGGYNNASSFIYSLKQINPYVNAFGVLTIIIVSILILSFNIYKMLTKRKRKILTIINSFNCYDQKYINLINKKIFNLKLYLEDRKKNSKIKKVFINYKYLKLNQKIINHKIKYNILKNNIKIKARKKFLRQLKSLSQNKKFFLLFFNFWRSILLTALGITSFVLLCSFYLISSNYDLSIANWGNYFTSSLLKEFKEETGYNIKYDLFDSNEDLYTKLYTYNKYDLMVPSTYMADRFAYENKIQKIDFSKIDLEKIVAQKYLKIENNKSNFWKCAISEQLEKVISDKFSSDSNINWTEIDLKSYIIPYFWADIRIAINPTEENLDFLKENGVKIIKQNNKIEIDPKNISWEILKKAANANKKIIISDDPKNLFFADSEFLLKKVEPTTKKEAEHVIDSTKTWINNKNVSIQGDEMLYTMSNKQFDFAMSYNQNILTANYILNETNKKSPIITVIPQKNGEGTDIPCDTMVLGKNSKHLTAAYKFINFFYQHQIELADPSAGIFASSVLKKTLNELKTNNNIYDGFYVKNKNLYLPLEGKEITDSDKGYGIFGYNKSDQLLYDQYALILSNKN